MLRHHASAAWPRVSVIVPALNEARNLPHVFARLPADVHEVIVVDGHSVDGTPEVARQLRPDVRVVMQTRKGKGNALACGFEAATGDVIAMVDADGSADPGEIPQFVKALTEGADFAKGTRFTDGAGSSDITGLRRMGNRVLSGLVNFFYGTRYSDLCYGFNVFWRRHVPVFGLDAASPPPAEGNGRLWGDGFEVETLINIRVAVAGLTVAEVPSFEHPRIYGVSNLNAFSDGLRVLRTILTERRQAGAWRGLWRLGRQPKPQGRNTARLSPPAGGPPAVATPADGRIDVPTLANGENRGDALTLRQTSVPAATSRAARPAVSVIVCAFTEDRWEDLSRAVDSLHQQTEQAREIIVVIDHCPGLLRRARRDLMGVTVVPNSAGKGLSGGRNTGALAASGDVIAFLDDDAAADPGWIAAISDCYRDPRVLGVGGLVKPAWDNGRPAWFPPELDWVVGCSYRGLSEVSAPVRNFIGANMSFRREVLDQLGGFSAGLGRVGAIPLGCEETELCLRASQLHPEGVLLYEPAAFVSHRVRTKRASWAYLRSRCYGEGLSKATVAKLTGSRRALASERSYLRFVIPRALVMALAGAARGRRTGLATALALIEAVVITGTGYAVGSLAASTTARNAVGTVHRATRAQTGVTS
jgi:glucosyl-dolichyl phosphate glucuronosyltransferase